MTGNGISHTNYKSSSLNLFNLKPFFCPYFQGAGMLDKDMLEHIPNFKLNNLDEYYCDDVRRFGRSMNGSFGEKIYLTPEECLQMNDKYATYEEEDITIEYKGYIIINWVDLVTGCPIRRNRSCVFNPEGELIFQSPHSEVEFDYEDDKFIHLATDVYLDVDDGICSFEGDVCIDKKTHHVIYTVTPIENSELCIAKIANQYGVVDKNGKIVIPIACAKLEVLDPLVFCINESGYCLLYKDERILENEGFCYEYEYSRNLGGHNLRRLNGNFIDYYFSTEDIRHCIYDTTGKEIFSNIRECWQEGSCFVICFRDKDNEVYFGKRTQFALYDSNMNPLYPEEYYDEIYSCGEGLLMGISSVEHTVFDDRGNKLFTTSKYDDIEDFENGRAIVRLEGKYGIIDKKGNEIIGCIYDEIPSLKMTEFI